MKKYLAVIPARGGSKRLPRKNVRLLGGKPLIAWSITAARNSGVFEEVLLSTDDDEVARIGEACGASVPWLRPSELATDTAGAADVLHHAATEFEKASKTRLDAIVLLQPTSPFRSAQTIKAALAVFEEAGGDVTVVGVSPANTHPYWTLKIDGEGNLTPFTAAGQNMRSQDLPDAYEYNGTIYIVPRDHLMQTCSIYTQPFKPYVITDPVECIDIDTPFDWAIAQCFALQQTGENNE